MSSKALAQASAQYAWPGIAAHWEDVCRAALTVEPPEIERVAAHVAAGRGTLALRMVSRLDKPADVPDAAWQALQSLVSGAAEGRGVDPTPCGPPARYFRSVRRLAAYPWKRDDFTRPGARRRWEAKSALPLRLTRVAPETGGATTRR